MSRSHRFRSRVHGSRPSWVAVAILGGLATGCYDGFDPLDPEVLAEVMRGRGDAEGAGHSGLYLGAMEALECGCPPIDQRLDLTYGATLCGLVEWAGDLGLEDALVLELVQGDGSVRVRALGVEGSAMDDALLLPTLYGSLRSDGRIAAGGVLQVDAFVVQGQARARVDGTLEGEPTQGTLEVEYQQHNAVDLLGSAIGDVLDGFNGDDEVLQTLDCRERIRLSLQWAGPPVPTFEIPGG